MDFLYVGIGGAIGSILRYCLSLLPIHTHFPFLTFITNIIGAILIGFITSLFDDQIISPQVNKLLKTGLCGGFTTFSTFSLETITLLENGQIAMGILYMMLSVLGCLIGVLIGKSLHMSLKF